MEFPAAGIPGLNVDREYGRVNARNLAIVALPKTPPKSLIDTLEIKLPAPR
jgi:hypothetical protein